MHSVRRWPPVPLWLCPKNQPQRHLAPIWHQPRGCPSTRASSSLRPPRDGQGRAHGVLPSRTADNADQLPARLLPSPALGAPFGTTGVAGATIAPGLAAGAGVAGGVGVNPIHAAFCTASALSTRTLSSRTRAR